MAKYYYYTSHIFKDNTKLSSNGACITDGEFPLSATMQDIAKRNGIKAKHVFISFFSEITKKEFENFKEIVNKKY